MHPYSRVLLYKSDFFLLIWYFRVSDHSFIRMDKSWKSTHFSHQTIYWCISAKMFGTLTAFRFCVTFLSASTENKSPMFSLTTVRFLTLIHLVGGKEFLLAPLYTCKLKGLFVRITYWFKSHNKLHWLEVFSLGCSSVEHMDLVWSPDYNSTSLLLYIMYSQISRAFPLPVFLQRRQTLQQCLICSLK